MNLDNKILNEGLPELYEHVDEALQKCTTSQTEFTEARDKFVKDNKLDETVIEA